MQFLTTVLLIAATSANAHDFNKHEFAVLADETSIGGENVEHKRLRIRGNYYEFTLISDEYVELKEFSKLVPVEVSIRDTDRGYLIACAIYDAAGVDLGADWGFSEYTKTSFYFEWDPETGVPAKTKCYRTEGLFPA